MPKPERQPRQRRAPKATVAETAPEAVKPKKERKKREPKERVAPDTIKIGIKEYAEMRVTAFQREFVKLHKILAPVPAKARLQIIAELNKVFG